MSRKKSTSNVSEAESDVFVYKENEQWRYEGKYTVSTGEVMRNGMGKMCYDGYVYEGEWLNDMMNGTGTLVYPNGESYKGEFKENKFEGKGKYVWPNGIVYEGEWKDGKMDGIGVLTMEGCRWTGPFEQGVAKNLKILYK
ncbi:hypothetical protein O9G_003551 [Rozella allomycis CSF55]|uniref:MORN repeat-containing protein n=1 Tax=Rozella allomycis (strain CSF55) TaxID=988480 RepID=A0A075AZY4_ROZAC|nr:hypothetical protein O9G_003551 [Rozella allomycis CSF55]|eukprot:EPZ35906.1 hypothetical protein O9G_003551 [Rozella allomycis CSF55]